MFLAFQYQGSTSDCENFWSPEETDDNFITCLPTDWDSMEI
jgi:hypothetical protein